MIDHRFFAYDSYVKHNMFHRYSPCVAVPVQYSRKSGCFHSKHNQISVKCTSYRRYTNKYKIGMDFKAQKNVEFLRQALIRRLNCSAWSYSIEFGIDHQLIRHILHEHMYKLVIVQQLHYGTIHVGLTSHVSRKQVLRQMATSFCVIKIIIHGWKLNIL